MVDSVKFANLAEKKVAQKTLQKKAKISKKEKEFAKYIQQIAREIVGQNKFVSLQRAQGDVAEFSANKVVQNYAGKLEINDSIWAPWSKSFITKK